MKYHNDIAILDGDENISRWVQECGRLDHDVAVRDRICPLIPEGGTVVDGGANIGSHTIPYAETVGKSGSVVACEPNPEAYQCLLHNTRNYPQVGCYNCAIVENTQQVFLAIDRQNPGGSHLAISGYKVNGIAIDHLHLQRCDLIKLDIEGAEMLALMGAVDTLLRCKPVLVLELNRGHLARVSGAPVDAVLSFLNYYRYKWELLAGTEADDQFDIIAKPL